MKKVLFSVFAIGVSLAGVEATFAVRPGPVKEESPTNATTLKVPPPVKKKEPSRKYTSSLTKKPVDRQELTISHRFSNKFYLDGNKFYYQTGRKNVPCFVDKGGSIDRAYMLMPVMPNSEENK